MKASAKYYSENPAAARRKREYQAKFNKRPDQVDKRVELNRINRRSQASGATSKNDGKDYDHAVKRFVKASTNRGRREKSRLKK